MRRALALFGVSRETEERLAAFVGLLRHWQRAHNLVSDASLASVWTRHVADSAQLATRFARGRRWLDLGSGAGFPGIVIAAMLAGEEGAHVHLVESDQKKAAFLSTVVGELGLPATVLARRIESVVKQPPAAVDWISARALAPLARLCEWLEPLVNSTAHAVLLKGANFDVELAVAALAWDIDLVRYENQVDSSGSIVEIKRLQRRDR